MFSFEHKPRIFIKNEKKLALVFFFSIVSIRISRKEIVLEFSLKIFLKV